MNAERHGVTATFGVLSVHYMALQYPTFDSIIAFCGAVFVGVMCSLVVRGSE